MHDFAIGFQIVSILGGVILGMWIRQRFGSRRINYSGLDKLRSAATGRVWKRLDEHRELAELISRKAPDLLNEQPLVARWFKEQDDFLATAVRLCHGQEYSLGNGLVAYEDFTKSSGPLRKAPAWMQGDHALEMSGLQICDKCHKDFGCGHEHSALVHDTGVCSICGETKEVVNCRLANLARNIGISDEDVWRHLPRLLRREGIADVEHMYKDFASGSLKP